MSITRLLKEPIMKAVRSSVQTVLVHLQSDLSKLTWLHAIINMGQVQILLNRRRRRLNDRWESCVIFVEENTFQSQSKSILSSVKRSGRWRRIRNQSMRDEKCLNLQRSLMRLLLEGKLIEMNTMMRRLRRIMKRHLFLVMGVDEPFYLIL